MNPIKKNILSLLATLVAVLGLSSNAFAEIVPWSITGPGVTSATQNNPGDWTLGYNATPAGFGTDTWTVSTTAVDGGSYAFNWDYSGFHAFFNVTAFLNTSDSTSLVNAGPANCCTSPSGGFSYNGTYTFNLNAGDTFGFTMGGHNFDSNNTLQGQLHLVQTTNVPEPATVTLLGLGLVGIGFARRRKQKAA